jgi:beta-glucosidase/6-phospho-beta-glucosidase/beta-galactosidase
MKGAWPPYLHGERGYVKLLMQLASGIVETVQAIRQAQPDAEMVHVEAAGINRAADPALAELAEQNRLKGFIVYDLITGRVTPEHPLFEWLLAAGARVARLQSLARRAIPVDIMGLNFYPQWSTQELFVDDHGKVASRAVEQDGSGFAAMVEDFYTRYGVPIMITETSARESDEVRSDWLNNSLAMLKRLRGGGIPVLGYTWFPMFTMINWDYRWGRKPLKHYLLDLGMYRLSHGGGHRRWEPSPLVAELSDYISRPDVSIGDLVALAK